MTRKKTERGSLEFYLGLKYPVTLYSDPEGGYVAEIKDLPGCITQGETVEEVLEGIEDARILWIESAYEHGDLIPLPSTETQYSGKTLLRMPRSLHQKLAEGAEREGVSFNQYVVSLLSEAIAAKTIDNIHEKINSIYESVCKQLVERSLENNVFEYKLVEKCNRKPASEQCNVDTYEALLALLRERKSPEDQWFQWLYSFPSQETEDLENLLSHKSELTQIFESKAVTEDKLRKLVKKFRQAKSST